MAFRNLSRIAALIFTFTQIARIVALHGVSSAHPEGVLQLRHARFRGVLAPGPPSRLGYGDTQCARISPGMSIRPSSIYWTLVRGIIMRCKSRRQHPPDEVEVCTRTRPSSRAGPQDARPA